MDGPVWSAVLSIFNYLWNWQFAYDEVLRCALLPVPRSKTQQRQKSAEPVKSVCGLELFLPNAFGWEGKIQFFLIVFFTENHLMCVWWILYIFYTCGVCYSLWMILLKRHALCKKWRADWILKFMCVTFTATYSTCILTANSVYV